MAELITIPSVARYLGVAPWQVRRLFERRLLPEPPRAGLVRLIKRSDLPVIEDLLRKVGYLSQEAIDQ
jgi:hypothetical protein